MRDLDDLFAALARSSFRSRFRLGPQGAGYLQLTILQDARDFVTTRLAPAKPKMDGKQTPMRGHPVFIAQHATATCCRSCLAKWHRIPAGVPLTADQIDYVVNVIRCWLQTTGLQP